MKEWMQKIRKKGKGVLAFLLAAVMVVGLVPSGTMEANAAEVSTVIWNASKNGHFPNQAFGYLNMVTLTGASVESFEVTDKTINVHLVYTTAKDASMTLTATAGGNMAKVSPATVDVTLKNGVVTQTITIEASKKSYQSMVPTTNFTVNIDIASEEEHTHNYNILEVVDESSHKKRCACGLSETETHSFGSWTKQDNENHVQSCACGAKITGAHEFGDWESADLTNHKKTCSVCTGAITEAHSFGNAEAIDDHKHGYTCTTCSKVKNEPHTWDAGTVTDEATESTAGSKVYTCSTCEKTRTETIYWNEVSTTLDVSAINEPTSSTKIRSFTLSGAVVEEYTVTGSTESQKGYDLALYSTNYGWKNNPTVDVVLDADTAEGTVLRVRLSNAPSDLKQPNVNCLEASFVSAVVEDGKAELIFPTVYVAGTYEYQTDWHFNFTVEEKHVCEYTDWEMVDEEYHQRSCTVEDCDNPDGKTQVETHNITATKTNANYHKAACEDCDYFTTEKHNWNDGEVSTPATTTTEGKKLYTCTAEGCGATKEETIPCIPTSVIKVKVDEHQIPSDYSYVREFVLEGANVYGIADITEATSELTATEETDTTVSATYKQNVKANVTLAAGTEDGTVLRMKLAEDGYYTVITSSGTMNKPSDWNTYVEATVEDGQAIITYPMTYIRNAGLTATKRAYVTYNVDWILNFTVDEEASVDDAPESIDIRLVAVNGSEDNVHSIAYEDAGDFEDWVVLDDQRYIGKDGDVFTFKAYDENGEETPVAWMANEGLGADKDVIDEEGNYTRKYLSFGSTSYNYITAVSKLDPSVAQEKRFFMTGYQFAPYYQNLTVTLSEDGAIATGNVNAGVKEHTDWEVSYPNTNAATIVTTGVKQDGIEFGFQALRPGTFNVTYVVDFDEENMTETTTVTVKGVAVEDSEGTQQKTYVEVSNDNANPTTQLTAYTAAGLSVAEWYSENESVATVDQNGLVTTKGVGSVLIHAVDSEGNVGGIKVVVTDADTPYFEDVDFVTGTAGLYPHLWMDNSFEATKLSYDVTSYTSGVQTLNMTAVYDSKWTAAYKVEYFDDTAEASGTVNNGTVTGIPVNGKECIITLTISDPDDADNATDYTFTHHAGYAQGSSDLDSKYKQARLSDIILQPYGHKLAATDLVNDMVEGTMYKAGSDGVTTESTGVVYNTYNYRTYILEGTDKFQLNFQGYNESSVMRYSADNGETWTRLPQGGGLTELIRFAEGETEVKVLLQVQALSSYYDYVNSATDVWTGCKTYTVWVEQKEAEALTIDIQLVAVNGSADNIYRDNYEDADDYDESKIMDDYIYYGKGGDKFAFKAIDQNGNESPVIWTIDEGIADKSGEIDENGVFTVDYLTFAVNSFIYVKATSTLDESVSQEKMFVMTGYGLHPAYVDPTVELDEDGKAVNENINAGVKNHTAWTVTYPKTNAAKIIETGVIQDGIEFDFQALRPGTFDVTYKVDFNDDMTETTTVTIKGVAVEDSTGAQQKTYVEMSNDNEHPTTQLTAYTAEGLVVTGWSSEDESIATVDANGLVTAQGVGNTIIHATDSEGNVGGIKVVVTHADIPYFEELNFARGNAGLNPHKWAEDSFKAALMEYEVETYLDTLATLPVTAVFNAEKWTASYEITYNDGTASATGTVENGAVVSLPISGKECIITITISDKTNAENKNVYTFAVNCELPGDSDEEQETVSGDISGDGVVTMSDAMTAYKISKGLAEATDAQKKVADVNGDGDITMADAMMIYKISRGMNN